MMEKFEFLLGDWNLEYCIPKSPRSAAATGSGSGIFRRALDDRFVYFDYVSLVNEERGSAHGVFGWDGKSEIHRYWWFENSGSFLTATCLFVNEDTLFLNWHDTLLIQTFTKMGPDRILLHMDQPDSKGAYGRIMEVVMSRLKEN